MLLDYLPLAMIQRCSVEILIFGGERSGKWNGIMWFIVQRSVEGIKYLEEVRFKDRH